MVKHLESFISKKTGKNGNIQHNAEEDQTVVNHNRADNEPYEQTYGNTSEASGSVIINGSDNERHHFIANAQIKTNPTENSKIKPRAVITGGVAFSADLSNYIIHMGVGHTIKLDKVLLNDGNGYSTYTGAFTVPRSGVYLLTFTINVVAKDSKTEVRLMKNNINIVDAIAWSTGQSHDTMGGNSAIIRLNQGDTVWLENYHQTDSELISHTDYIYTTFSGVLMYS